MQTRLLVPCFLVVLEAMAFAQTPPPQPQPAPPAPAAQPVRRRPTVSAVPTTVTLTVTDPSGNPISGVKVTSVGPLSRESSTTDTGIARLQSVKAGDYRFRFEKQGFIMLERDATVKGGSPLSLDIVLNPAPELPKPPPPAPVAPAAVTAPAGEPKALLIADFADSNRLKGSDPIREDQLGCTASAKTELLQIRDSLPEKSQADADEAIYVVAGTGTLRLGNKDVPLEASSLAIVPRGTVRSLTRKGNRPLIVLSVLSGPACTK